VRACVRGGEAGAGATGLTAWLSLCSSHSAIGVGLCGVCVSCAHQCDVGQRRAVLQPSVACWQWCVSDISLCVLVLNSARVLLGGQAAW
jgi:hypothetical protein